ncbi:PREDICTED: cancer/testis antigen 62 [Colobus angolensis palliatus]|uniref:cancer/testis antigen 62 n=1 Tax=Colobus angolensis palliatus TaxID=336983 RepID=UPI0005F51AB7|nr:PREDICTED: cancer/testis antigen 62 [Colobus angolensis palliatus]
MHMASYRRLSPPHLTDQLSAYSHTHRTFSHFSCGPQPAAGQLAVGLWNADLQSEFPCPCLGLTLYLTCNPQLGKRKFCSHSSEDMSKMVSRRNVKDSHEVAGRLQATLQVISFSFPFLLHSCSHPLSRPTSGQRR